MPAQSKKLWNRISCGRPRDIIWKTLCAHLGWWQEWLKLEKLCSTHNLAWETRLTALGLPQAAQKSSRNGPGTWDHRKEGKSPWDQPGPRPSGSGRSPGSLPTSFQHQTEGNAPEAHQKESCCHSIPTDSEFQIQDLSLVRSPHNPNVASVNLIFENKWISNFPISFLKEKYGRTSFKWLDFLSH